MSATLRYEFDPDADAIYVYLSEKEYAHGEDLNPERRVHFAKDGSPIGVELTCVSHGVHLADLPAVDEISRLLASLNIKILV
jgi:uncharacterized protein YuzE